MKRTSGNFQQKEPGSTESFDSYLAEIRNMAKLCNFCDCLSDSLIKDRIVMGVYDAGTRKHLLQKRQLALQAATDICRSDEAATAQMKSISDSAEIHLITKSHSGGADKKNSAWKPGISRGHRTMQRRQNATYSDGDVTRTCKLCGRIHPQKKDCCPAWGRTCRRCAGRNHFSNCCNMVNKKVHTVDRCERSDEESIIALDKGRYTKGPIYAEIWMNDKSVKFQIVSRTLPGKVHLHVEEGAKPVQCPARRVPVTLKPKLKAELDRIVERGVICPIENPTEWCNQISIQTKKDASLRVYIDPRPLNKVLQRELYPSPTMEEVLPEMPTAGVLSKVDIQSGYWHCELDHESSLLTTIITSFGRYRWNCLPFGMNVNAEILQRKLNQTLEGLEGVACVADDIVVFGHDDEDHDKKLRLLLQRCRETGM